MRPLFVKIKYLFAHLTKYITFSTSSQIKYLSPNSYSEIKKLNHVWTLILFLPQILLRIWNSDRSRSFSPSESRIWFSYFHQNQNRLPKVWWVWWCVFLNHSFHPPNKPMEPKSRSKHIIFGFWNPITKTQLSLWFYHWHIVHPCSSYLKVILLTQLPVPSTGRIQLIWSGFNEFGNLLELLPRLLKFTCESCFSLNLKVIVDNKGNINFRIHDYDCE